MKVYKSADIRNVAIASHQGSGKTTLMEAAVFTTGAINRMGKVVDGNTVSDFRPAEVKRTISVNTSLAALEWDKNKINILDVPGFTDFLGEIESAIPVVESVIMAVDAASGVGVSTEQISALAKEQNKAQVFFVNKLDRENADFEKAIESMKNALDVNVVAAQLPIGAEANFKGIIDLLENKAYEYDDKGKSKEIDIPADMADAVEEARIELMEAAAEGDDDLMMKYLEGEELSADEIKVGLKGAIVQGSIAPVLCGSAFKNIGTDLMLNFITHYLPAPSDVMDMANAEKPFAGLVFKTVTDAFLGKLSYTKVMQGCLSASLGTIHNVDLDKDEKLSDVATFLGKNKIAVNEFNLGDIGVIAKLPSTATNHTITAKGTEAELEKITFSVPNYTVAIAPKSKNDEDKLGAALQKILEEDPTLICVKDKETHQTLLTGMGETHIAIALERLQNQYGVAVETIERRLPYRETIRGTAQKVEGKHKKQSGGHGQFGHVFIDIEPCEEDFVFEEKIFGGSVPKQYIPAVEKGLRESLEEGVLAGYPVSHVKVTLVDGSYHPVDSSEMAFKIATNVAFKKACEMAKPVLLEPMVDIEIKVPDQYTGDIMGDMNGARRGRIMGMEREGKIQVIKAVAPLAEMSRYSIDLKSMTQGRGKFTMKFANYEEAPQNIAEKVIAEHKKEKEQ
jgi:elongation factor G